MRPLTRGWPIYAALSALLLIFGCDSRIDTGTNPPYIPIYHLDMTLTVYDDAGAVLPGATVRLYLKSGSGAVFVTSQTTNSKGQVTFLKPDYGDYLVYASKDGYIGTSQFATVGQGSVVANDLKLSPITSLPDYVQISIPAASGGTATTAPIGTVGQSSVTFGAGVLNGDATVTIATLTGQQVPVVPAGQVALSAVVVTASSTLNGTATVSFSLPFDLPDGTSVPIYIFDSATNSWVLIATGTVSGGQLMANIGSLGSLSALAAFVPKKTNVVPEVVTSTRALSPSDGAVITTTWTPRLSFPAGTNYSDKTKAWIQSSIEALIGLKFNQPVTVRLVRDPAATQTLSTLTRVDAYTISVQLGTPKITRSNGTTTLDFVGNASTQQSTINNIEHNSGFGGGG